MNKKGIKTTVVAFIILIAFLGIILALIYDKVDKSEFTMLIGSLGTVGTIIVGFLAKDYNKSHSNDGPVITPKDGGELPPDDDE